MALSRSKYKRVTALYTVGREVEFPDGSVMWVQVMNPFEREEALRDGHAARGRFVKAMKSEHGSDEQDRLEGAFVVAGRAVATEQLINGKVTGELPRVINEIRADKDWKERLEILERSTELLARPADDSERAYLQQVSEEYVTEIQARQEQERVWLTSQYEQLSDDDLLTEVIDFSLERRGNEIAYDEYSLTELWLSARCCEARKLDDASWDHASCEGHQLRVWETKEEARSQPAQLQELIRNTLVEVTMSDREAKNSDRQESSSASSPLPSEPEESTPSIQIETPAAAPGIFM